MLKKIIFHIVSFILGVVIFFVVGEICFRVFDGPPNMLANITQQKREYIAEPNSSQIIKSSQEGEFEYTANYNKYGYRGKDFEMPKKEGVTRVFVVGDSFTHGVGAEDDQTIPAIIESKLLAKNYNVEVVNAGAGHTSPITHYMNIRDIHLNYAPDVVLLLLDLTDLRDDWQRERNAVYDEAGEIQSFHPMIVNGKRDWWITAIHYSSFCKWIHNKIVRSICKAKLLGFRNYLQIAKEGKRAKGQIAISGRIKNEKDILEYDNLILARGMERKDMIDKYFAQYTAKYLTKIKNLLGEHKIPLIIGMYPYGIYVGADHWTTGRIVWGFEPGKMYTDWYPFDLVKKYAESKGIPFVNTLDDFLKSNIQQPLFFDYDGHLTPSGNEIVAQSIVASNILQNTISIMQTVK